MTTAFITAVMNLVFRQIATSGVTNASNWYVAMFYNVPSLDGTTAPNEVAIGTTTGYARLAISRSTTSPALSAPSNGTVSNINALQFAPAATAYNSPIQSIGIFSAATGGTLLMVSELTTYKTIEQGDYGFFNAGGIQFTMS